MIPSSYALAVLAAISYGAADFLGGLATRRFAVYAVVVVSQLTGLILVVLALPLLPPASAVAGDFAWGAASGLAGGIGVALLYRGLAVGTMSVVAPVTAVCAVIIPLAVGTALGERPAALALLGVVLALVAIVLVSQAGADTSGTRRSTGVPIAIASGIAIGIFLVCLERTGPAAGLWPLVAARIVSVGFLSGVALTRGEAIRPGPGSMPILVACGALDMLANTLYLLAVRDGPLGIVATLSSLYPASTVILARVVLQERLRPAQVGGVVCAAAAIVLIVSA
jgi:drug/metabolite transporter (DMT)-like permease